jgi:hypothetical protein
MKNFILLVSLFLSVSSFAQTSVPQTNVKFNLTCSAALNDMPISGWLFIDKYQESAQINLGYGVLAQLSRIDNTRFLITVTANGKSYHPPTILDAKRTTYMAMTSSGATLVCKPQVESL